MRYFTFETLMYFAMVIGIILLYGVHWTLLRTEPFEFTEIFFGYLWLLGAASIVFYAWYRYRKHHATKPALFYKDTPFNRQLLDECKVIQNSYEPTFWMVNAHVQVQWAEHIKKRPNMDLQREFLNTRDGGTVCLDWYNATQDPEAPILILLHGLTGGSHSKYVRHFAEYMVQQAKKSNTTIWRPVFFVRRGCGVNPITSPTPYSLCNLEDFQFVLNHIKQKYPKAPMYGVGFSAGATVLSKYLGVMGKHSEIKGAVLASGAYEFDVATQSSTNLIGKMYDRILCMMVKRKTFSKGLHHFHQHKHINIIEASNARTIREFDAHFTSKVFGFKSVEEFYTHSASHSDMPNIQVPTLAIHALDDPILLARNLPFSEIVENKLVSMSKDHLLVERFKVKDHDHLVVCITPNGAHHSYLEGLWPMTHSWLDRAGAEFLFAVRALEQNTQ
jgi:predicted alpha/beta-fold hydrolase